MFCTIFWENRSWHNLYTCQNEHPSMATDNIFHFKQFSVDQSGCAMKVNTDGVLLAALVEAENLKQILDVGTGTGIIALMLAQRYPKVRIDAIEIDGKAAQTAQENFNNSPFVDRVTLYSQSFEEYFDQYPQTKFDLIISNPPFFINSFKSNTATKGLARHTDKQFFHRLVSQSATYLNESGLLTLILPIDTAELVCKIAYEHHLHLQNEVIISSFSNSTPHRTIISFGLHPQTKTIKPFVIYDEPKVYSKEYSTLLKDFLTIF